MCKVAGTLADFLLHSLPLPLHPLLNKSSSAFSILYFPLQYSSASLLAQLVKNPPAMWEIWVLFLGWEDPLEEGKAIHSSILAWRIPRTI